MLRRSHRRQGIGLEYGKVRSLDSREGDCHTSLRDVRFSMALMCPDGTRSHGYFQSSPDDLKYDRHMGKDGIWSGMVVGERRGRLPRAFQAHAMTVSVEIDRSSMNGGIA